MATRHLMGALALALGLAGNTAFADEPGKQQKGSMGQGQESQGKENIPGREAEEQKQPGAQQPGVGQKGHGYGAGLGEPGKEGATPIPQYWIADAALFTGNAASTANVLGQEQALNVQSKEVLGNQAQFLVAATNRALSSLMSLQQSAEATNPAAVSEIRSAVGQLIAAQAQANQVADAANAGVLGPTFEASVRSAQTHLAAAERALVNVGRRYGAPQLAMAGTCPMRGAFGAGLGGRPGGAKGGAPQHQPGGAKQGTPQQGAPQQQGTPQQEGTPQQQGAPQGQ